MLRSAKDLSNQIIGWRRHLHAHPELSGAEAETAAFVAERLREFGLAPRTGVAGANGVVCDLGPTGRGDAIALRADMDALPIHEDTALPFASQNPGVMHACGHDAHTAMLLGAARLLSERQPDLPRPVRLIFQPHEEKFPGGAKPLIDAGVLAGVSACFGLHITSWLPTGLLGVRRGPFMAAVSDVAITVHGRGGHAAQPEECIDPVVLAAQIVLGLQTIVSRGVGLAEQAVLSITQLHGGTADNVIPDEVRLRGTLRTFDEAVRDRVTQRIHEVANGLASAAGATVAVDVRHGYPVLRNHAEATDRAVRVARGLGFAAMQVAEMQLQGGGEDFAYYGQVIPSAFLFLGARNDARQCVYPHHHPRFNIDEDVLWCGAALLAGFAAFQEADDVIARADADLAAGSPGGR